MENFASANRKFCLVTGHDLLDLLRLCYFQAFFVKSNMISIAADTHQSSHAGAVFLMLVFGAGQALLQSFKVLTNMSSLPHLKHFRTCQMKSSKLSLALHMEMNFGVFIVYHNTDSACLSIQYICPPSLFSSD